MYMGFSTMKNGPPQAERVAPPAGESSEAGQTTGSKTVTPQSTSIVWAVTPVASQAR
jgi:hypothetical protein